MNLYTALEVALEGLNRYAEDVREQWAGAYDEPWTRDWCRTELKNIRRSERTIRQQMEAL